MLGGRSVDGGDRWVICRGWTVGGGWLVVVSGW
jgi:hypothetical protein